MYAIFLVGPPGTGKSTYAKNELPSDFPIFSTDDLIAKEAERLGTHIDEIFQEYYSRAEELFHAQIMKAQQFGMPFIIDRTNCSEQSRKKRLNLIKSDYKKIAIYFPAYTVNVLYKRVQERVSRGGHGISFEDLERFHREYRLPQKTEGFDLVVSSSHFIDIQKVMDFK